MSRTLKWFILGSLCVLNLVLLFVMAYSILTYVSNSAGGVIAACFVDFTYGTVTGSLMARLHDWMEESYGC